MKWLRRSWLCVRPTRRRLLPWAVLLAACAWGLFLRIANLGSRPFWCDEAWAADAVSRFSCLELLRQVEVPLPPLFAVLTRLMLGLGGPPELWLRVLPAVCGALALPGVYAAARLLRGPRTLALAATGLCASSVMLVIWSRELKHYSFEALAAALAAVLVFGARRSAEPVRWLFAVALPATCLIAPWVAYGAVFPLAAMVPLLIVGRPVVGSRRGLVLIGLTSLAGLAVSLAVLWQVAAGGQAYDPALAHFTSYWCIDAGNLDSWARGAFYTSHASVLVLFPATWFVPARTDLEALVLAGAALLVWSLVVLGLRFWPRHGRVELAWWLFGPLLLMLAAALAGVYPFGQARMMQFCAPPMLVALTAGLVGLWRRLWILWTGRGGPALVCGVLVGLLPATYVVRIPLQHRYYYYHDFPAVLRTLAELRSPGELVLVELTAVPPVRYYAPDLSPPVIYAPIAAGVAPPPDADYAATAEEAARLAGRRLWVLTGGDPYNEVRNRMLRRLRDRRYVIRVVASERPEVGYGSAELLLAEWR